MPSSLYEDTMARGIRDLDSLEDFENEEDDMATEDKKITPSALLQEDGSFRWECPLCPYVAVASVTRRIHTLKDKHKKKHPGMNGPQRLEEERYLQGARARAHGGRKERCGVYLCGCVACQKGYTTQQAALYTQGTRVKAKVVHWKKEHPDMKPRGVFGIAYRRTLNEHNGWRLARARVNFMNKRLPIILRHQHDLNGHNFRWVYFVQAQTKKRFRPGLFRLDKKKVYLNCGRGQASGPTTV